MSVAIDGYPASARPRRRLAERWPALTKRRGVPIVGAVPKIVVPWTRLRLWVPQHRALVTALSVACVCVTVIDTVLLALALSS